MTQIEMMSFYSRFTDVVVEEGESGELGVGVGVDGEKDRIGRWILDIGRGTRRLVPRGGVCCWRGGKRGEGGK